MKSDKFLIKLWVLLSFLLCSSYALSAVVELLPGQNNPSVTPKTIVGLSMMQGHYAGVVRASKNSNTTKTQEIETSFSIIHLNSLATLPVLAAASVGWRDLDYPITTLVGQDSHREGVHDFRFALGCWPWVDKVQKHHFGLALVGNVPTGGYDKQQFVNSGENKYRASAVLDLKLSFSPHWYSETFLLFNWIGENDAYYLPQASNRGRLSQAPTSSITSYLTYQSPNYWQAFLGLEKINGADQYWSHDVLGKFLIVPEQEDVRAYLGATLPWDARNIMQIRFGKSLEVSSGYDQTQQIIFRVSHVL